MSPAARLLLVRHAEPTDRDRCHGARSDPGLSAAGHRQAEEVALRALRLLRDPATEGPGDAPTPLRLVTSPAARARVTAAAMARVLAATPEVDERWRERDFGTWEGRPWDELWPTVPPPVTHDPGAYLAWTPPEGETAAAVAARVEPALEEALAGAGTTVVVTHAGAVRQALASALGLPLATTLRIEVAHASVVGLARTGDAVTLTHVGA